MHHNGLDTGKRPNKIHNTDIKLFLMCSKCCHPVDLDSLWGSVVIIHIYESVTEAIPSSFCQQNRITSVCCGNIYSQLTRIHIRVYPQFRPHKFNSISTLHLSLSSVTGSPLPCFSTPHFPPIFFRASPVFHNPPTHKPNPTLPNLLDFCNASSGCCSSGCSRSSSAYTQFAK